MSGKHKCDYCKNDVPHQMGSHRTQVMLGVPVNRRVIIETIADTYTNSGYNGEDLSLCNDCSHKAIELWARENAPNPIKLIMAYWLMRDSDEQVWTECEICHNADPIWIAEMCVDWWSPVPQSTNCICQKLSMCDECRIHAAKAWELNGAKVYEAQS